MELINFNANYLPNSFEKLAELHRENINRFQKTMSNAFLEIEKYFKDKSILKIYQLDKKPNSYFVLTKENKTFEVELSFNFEQITINFKELN